MHERWQQLMEIGLGVLHIPPDQFWRMTLPEFNAAFEGYLAALGVDKHAIMVASPLHREELAALQQRFPDV